MGVSELAELLSASRQRLLRAISGVTEQHFKQLPAATDSETQSWCIAEVLAHLLLAERERSGWIEQALAGSEPAIEPMTPAALDAQTRAARMAPVPQLIHGLLAARRELEQRLDRAAADDALQRAVRHPEQGRLDIELLVGGCAEAEEEHAERIEALRIAVGARALEV